MQAAQGILRNRAGLHGAALHNIKDLWDQYGLDPPRWILEERSFADCLAGWLKFLYGDEYGYWTDEILGLIEKEQDEQREAGRRMDETTEIGCVLFVPAESIVTEQIIGNAPPY